MSCNVLKRDQLVDFFHKCVDADEHGVAVYNRVADGGVAGERAETAEQLTISVDECSDESIGDVSITQSQRRTESRAQV